MLKKTLFFKKDPLNSEHGPFFQCKGVQRCIKSSAKMQFSLKMAPSDYWPEISLLLMVAS